MSADSAETSWRDKDYQARLERIARALERLATRVTYEGSRLTPPVGGGGRYASSAASVVHDVFWGLANLHLDALTLAAAECDLAERGTVEDKT